MFDKTAEDDLTPSPSLRNQLVAHVPIAIIVVGLLAMFFALHVAVTGLAVLAIAHVALGLALLLIRRHRHAG